MIIRLPANYYVKEIDKVIEDSVYREGAVGLDCSIGVILKTIVVMDGDWDNGQDKCELAKRHMGPKWFELFKEKYPKKYENICGNKISDR